LLQSGIEIVQPIHRHRSFISNEAFVYVTPAPILARLEGSNYSMLRMMKVFCRVPVLRIVAAPDVPANQTFAQVHPAIAHLEALLAAIARRANVANLLKVRTSLYLHGRDYDLFVNLDSFIRQSLSACMVWFVDYE